MLHRSTQVSLTKVALMMMIFGSRVEAAPTERGFGNLPDPFPSLTHTPGRVTKVESPIISVIPEKTDSSVLNLRPYMKQWLLTTKPTGLDRTTKNTARTTTAGARPDRRLRISPKTASPDKRAQILKMISSLEELHRTINNTLSTRIIIMPRANGRNSGRKNKVLPAVEGSQKPTTVSPVDTDDTASRASADVIIPSSLTGRNFKKSLPPQPKKTNKRVCFWKYCSQN